MEKFEPRYWNHVGRYQGLYEKLTELIPLQGEVPSGRGRGKNRRLEGLRKAANQYYDLYNNGLMNRAVGFHTRFGVTKDEALRWDFGDYKAHEKIDKAMDKIIMAAAIEQEEFCRELRRDAVQREAI